MKKVLVVALATVLAAASGAAAQDASAPATYGSVRLGAGFTPDPHAVQMTAGGTIDASGIGSPCTGSIARAPDYELTYTAGSLPLYIYAEADSDTTLVVNGPDGRWYCDDDSNGNLNPQVTFNSPSSGTYDIWVGTFDGGTASATLHISELSQDDDSWSESANSEMPDSSLRATYGEVSLNWGFTPDPHRVSLTAGGPIPASNLGSSCAGMISRAPDYQVTYNATKSPLIFRTRAETDTTLVVNAPDSEWYCDDDGAETSLDAQVTFTSPLTGVYDVWVGTYGEETRPAELIVTEWH